MQSSNKKAVIGMLLVVTLFTLVSAQQIYTEDTQIDLKIPCFNNDTYCSSSSTCNLTIINSNGSALINNLQMTQNTAYHNFTLNKNQTESSGKYRVAITCIDGSFNGHSTFEIIITPTGNSLDISSSIIQGFILIIMFGVTLFFLAFAHTTEIPGVKLFFNLIAYVTMLLSVATGYILVQNSGVQSGLSTTVNSLMFVVGIVFVLIMYYVMINQTRAVFALMRAKRGFGSDLDNPPTF